MAAAAKMIRRKKKKRKTIKAQITPPRWRAGLPFETEVQIAWKSCDHAIFFLIKKINRIRTRCHNNKQKQWKVEEKAVTFHHFCCCKNV
jgi:hypothetical protein